MIAYKDRKIEFNKPCRVYRNLNFKKQKFYYSIQQKIEGKWKVVAHAKYIYLEDCKFKVSRAGVERIRANKKKAVVAYIEGTYIKSNPTTMFPQNMVEFSFNPYTHTQFTLKNGDTVLGASKVIIHQQYLNLVL